ncbi:TIM barrel protein [Parabacteroides sp. PF5-9]|uniref:TIM barrel protein n=1 Tax=Parabacteroides sp. PF5-9 TaxID=1742404 RepID=UPI0024752F2B|nr:TIM barrel protein [Parabacteroides sp. PF5-9]MDH6358264.1 sugar phosphate isomerase/epimerase [Parabacteroides sp. PF5-9]
MTTRRDFLKTGAALAALCAVPNGFTACSSTPKEKAIGVQLYSVREELQKDFDGTMKALAEIGYKRFESYGYRDGKFFGKTPKEMKQYMRDLGGQMTGSHTGLPLLGEGEQTEQWDSWKKNVDDTAELGCKWIVQASYPARQIQQISDVKRLADQFNRCGEIAQAAGLRFAFHNHVDEFRILENEVPFDVMLNHTEKGLVAFQIDTAQMVYGGYACDDYVKRYPGRFANWHLKDANPDGEGSTEFGKGLVDFEALFAVADMAVLEDYYVEQERYNMTPLEALKYDFDFLMHAPYVKW